LTPPAKPPMKDDLVAVWFAFGLVLALFVATAAGLLGRHSGQSATAAMLTAAEYFGGTLTLVILAIKLLRR
jgi:hypothetical protein